MKKGLRFALNQGIILLCGRGGCREEGFVGKKAVLARELALEAADAKEAAECEGHPAGEFDRMGETVYCDGTCRGGKAL